MAGKFTFQGDVKGVTSASMGYFNSSSLGATGSQIIIQGNPLRCGAVFYNNSDVRAYVMYGDHCGSDGNFTFIVPEFSGSYFMEPAIYAGNIAALMPSLPTTGSFVYTELVN